MQTDIIQNEEINVSPISVDIVRWNAYSIEAEQTANFIEIGSDEENIMATGTLSKIKQFGKEVESARTETVKPLNDLVKRVNGMYKPITDSLAKSETIIKGKMIAFAQEKERIRREEEARRQKEFEAAQKKALADAKKNKTEPVIVEPPKPLMEQRTVRSEEGAATIVKTWKGEVSDPVAILKAIIEKRVSISVIEFKPVELNNYAKAKKENGVFDGIKVYEHQNMMVR